MLNKKKMLAQKETHCRIAFCFQTITIDGVILTSSNHLNEFIGIYSCFYYILDEPNSRLEPVQMILFL